MTSANDILTDLEMAVRYFINKLLDGKGRITDRIVGSKGSICVRVVDLRQWKEDRVYYVGFNRSVLNAFGRVFEMPNESISQGQTIHLKVIDYASKREQSPDKTFIVIMMHDTRSYTASLSMWVYWIHVHKTIRPIPGETLLSASMPLRFMKQFEEDEKKGKDSLLSYMEQ